MSVWEAVLDATRGRSKPRLSFGVLRDYGIVLALLVLFVALTFSSNIFLTQRNLLNILDQWTPVALMALGGTVVLLAGGFDFSIGGIYAITGLITAQAAKGTADVLGWLSGLGEGVGLGGGLAGILVVSRSLSANPTGSAGIQFNVWAAMLLGGNSVFGGIGSAWRTVVGVLLLALIQNGFDLLSVDPLWQQIATGLILL